MSVIFSLQPNSCHFADFVVFYLGSQSRRFKKSTRRERTTSPQYSVAHPRRAFLLARLPARSFYLRLEKVSKLVLNRLLGCIVGVMLCFCGACLYFVVFNCVLIVFTRKNKNARNTYMFFPRGFWRDKVHQENSIVTLLSEHTSNP